MLSQGEFENLKSRLRTGVADEGGREVAAHDRPEPETFIRAMKAYCGRGDSYKEYWFYFQFPFSKADAPRRIKARFDHYFGGRAMLDIGEERRAA